MPVMDGSKRRGRSARSLAWKSLPILAMTANAMAGDRERSIAAGMNDHIPKPIDLDEMFDVPLRWLPHVAGQSAAVSEAPVTAAPQAETRSDANRGFTTSRASMWMMVFGASSGATRPTSASCAARAHTGRCLRTNPGGPCRWSPSGCRARCAYAEGRCGKHWRTPAPARSRRSGSGTSPRPHRWT